MSAKATRKLSVGAAMVDITPALGAHLCGAAVGQYRPAETVLEPLYAKATVFESGGRRVCIIVMDLTIITEPHTRRIREAVAKALKTAPEAVLICAVQTHSSPSLGDFMLDPDFPLDVKFETLRIRGSESAYNEFVIPKAIEAATRAGRNVQPAEMAFGRGLLGDFAFNRRGVRRDGRSIVMPKPFGETRQPLGPPDLCYLEGPIDPEVGVASIRSGGRTRGLLLHYTCHPVINYGKKECYHALSPDWPGAWSEEMRARLGDDCVPMVINGCCGNINPWHPFDPAFEPDHRRMGRALAEMTGKISDGLTYASDAVVGFASRRVPLPYREIPRKRAAEVERILSKHPLPVFTKDGGVDATWFRAASTRSVELAKKRSAAFDYEIQVLRLGEAAIVGLPGEPFVEGQLAIKVNSPAKHVQVAHMTSKYVGYLPTLEACRREGHETNADVTYWAKLAPGALETVVENAREMIGQLFKTARSQGDVR